MHVSRTLIRAGVVGLVVTGVAGGSAAVAMAGSHPASTQHTTTASNAHKGVSGHSKKHVPLPPGLGGDVPGRDLGWWPYGNVVHGAFVIESRNHTLVPVVVQRGTVTAMDAHSVTVRSGDKVVMTWTTTASTREVARPKRHHKSFTLAVGASVGVWGSGTADAATATVILMRSPGASVPAPAPSASPAPTPSDTPSQSPAPTPPS